MKIYDVCGLGNGIADILLEINENDFQKLGIKRASFELQDLEQQQRLLDGLSHVSPVLASGGSVANSVIAVSQLGGKSAFICCLGDDQFGLFYKNEFDALGIEIGNPIIMGEMTGSCAVLVTPDAERTMRTTLGVAAKVSAKQVAHHEETIKCSKWLFIEGYVFANNEYGQGAVKKAIELAKRHSCKIAITFSDAFVVNAFGPELREAVFQSDLIFANEEEAAAFTGKKTVEESFQALKSMVPSAVVTAGPRGAWVRLEKEEAHVEAFSCTPLDLTGAGDMLAGSFLYGITHGLSAAMAARAGCYLAKQVITRVGARLHTGTKEYWNEIVSQGGA